MMTFYPRKNATLIIFLKDYSMLSYLLCANAGAYNISVIVDSPKPNRTLSILYHCVSSNAKVVIAP